MANGAEEADPTRIAGDRPKQRFLPTALGALGVVFGDIGTSPVYTFRECFNPEYGLSVDPEHVLGVLSLIFWALVLVVAVKYVLLVMQADNQGEGGILALLALALKPQHSERTRWVLIMLGLAGAALFYGDSMITPAISVLSAVEGVGVATAALNPWILPITAVILVLLFLSQRFGTERVGKLFGPVMVVWFAVIAMTGALQLAHHPSVLAAIDPFHALGMLVRHPKSGFVVLGAVALAITGAEALYADMGHFGRFPIRASWFAIVMPALVLNYFGQGALILDDPSAISNPFFRMAPAWSVVPLVVLTTAATVIASQAVISGAFSLTRQAIQLGDMPRLDVIHTSTEASGQIYVPQINWLLMVAVLGLVFGFGSSSALASAYGLAVTGTMGLTTILAGSVMIGIWGWRPLLVIATLAPLMAIDLALFSANGMKIASGGWFPLAIGAGVFVLITTWRKGRLLVLNRLGTEAAPLTELLTLARQESRRRVGRDAVFFSTRTDRVPATLLNNYRHNRVLHERVILVHVMTADTPWVAAAERATLQEIGDGIWTVGLVFGFAETPDVPAGLREAGIADFDPDADRVSYFFGRAIIRLAAHCGMRRWRASLYSGLVRISTHPTEFFCIPANRVIEIGAEVDI